MKSHLLRLTLACLWCWATFIPFRAKAIPLWQFLAGSAPVESDLPPASSVIAWYSLESNANDSSGNGRNMAATGTPGHGTGKVDNALLNDSSSEWYSIASASWQAPTGDFSICAWIRAADITPSSAAGILTRYPTTAGNRVFLFRVETTGKIALIVSSDGSAAVSDIGDTVMSNNTWYFVCGVFKASTSITVYLNGVQDSIPNTTSIPAQCYQSASQSMQLATYSSSSSNTFIGDIDEVGFFNIALTPAQVAALYADGDGVTFDDLP